MSYLSCILISFLLCVILAGVDLWAGSFDTGFKWFINRLAWMWAGMWAFWAVTHVIVK